MQLCSYCLGQDLCDFFFLIKQQMKPDRTFNSAGEQGTRRLPLLTMCLEYSSLSLVSEQLMCLCLTSQYSCWNVGVSKSTRKVKNGSVDLVPECSAAYSWTLEFIRLSNIKGRNQSWLNISSCEMTLMKRAIKALAGTAKDKEAMQLEGPPVISDFQYHAYCLSDNNQLLHYLAVETWTHRPASSACENISLAQFHWRDNMRNISGELFLKVRVLFTDKRHLLLLT